MFGLGVMWRPCGRPRSEKMSSAFLKKRGSDVPLWTVSGNASRAVLGGLDCDSEKIATGVSEFRMLA